VTEALAATLSDVDATAIEVRSPGLIYGTGCVTQSLPGPVLMLSSFSGPQPALKMWTS
jgi:hypothetical protein